MMETQPETRQRILEAAEHLFSKKGYTASSLREIAKKSQIGKATIYHHFPDKESIVMALYQKGSDSLRTVLARVRAEKDPQKRIKTAAEASLDSLGKASDILQIVRREVPKGRETFQREFAQFMKSYVTLIAESIQEGAQKGLFRDVDACQAAKVFQVMIQGMFASAYLSGETPRRDGATIDAMLDVFLKGIQK